MEKSVPVMGSATNQFDTDICYCRILQLHKIVVTTAHIGFTTAHFGTATRLYFRCVEPTSTRSIIIEKEMVVLCSSYLLTK